MKPEILLSFFLVSVSPQLWGSDDAAALFVANRMGPTMEPYVVSFQDYLRAELGDVYGMISPDTVFHAVQSLRGNPSYTTKEDKTQAGMINSAGMQQMATMLNADFILLCTLNSFNEKKLYSARFKRSTYTYSLKVTYQFAYSSNGAAFQGDVVNVSTSLPVPDGLALQLTNDEILEGLLEKAAGKIRERLLKKPAAIVPNKPLALSLSSQPPVHDSPDPRPLSHQPFGIFVIVQIQGLKVPEFVKNANGDYLITGRSQDVTSTDASVYIDGIRVGTSSAIQKLPVSPGIHRIKVQRTGFVSKEEFIRPYEGMRLHFTLEPTKEEVLRWNRQLAFISGVRQGEKLTDARVKALEGFYQFLSNSKYETPDITIQQTQKKLF